MNPTLTWTIVAIAAVVAVVAIWFALEKRRRRRLRDRFGNEYERAVHDVGNVRQAEAALEARTKRVERLHIRPLSPDQSAQFTRNWQQLQQRFVDDPQGAVSEADRLVGEVMSARGYPLGDFDQRAADLSVDHPRVVAHYRAAREIALRHARGQATTEDLRQAFVHYRALFTDLLELSTTPSSAAPMQNDPELIRGRR
jgi:hypothetical protein